MGATTPQVVAHAGPTQYTPPIGDQEAVPNYVDNGDHYDWNNDQLRVTDQFGWHQSLFEPGANQTPPTRHGDVQDMTFRSADVQVGWQPDDYEGGEETIIGPVHGASHNSPWFGNFPRDLAPQYSQTEESVGPVSGGTSAVKTWRQWLAATEVPNSTIASEVFASVRDFPYAFRG